MNSEPLSNDQVEKALLLMSGWEVDDEDNKLRCELEVPDFRAAMAFLTRFAFECEDLDHHAEILNVYSTIRLALTTHDAGGKITEKDLQLAKRVCELISAG